MAEDIADYLVMPDIDKLTQAVCEHVVDGDTAWFRVVEDGIEVTHKVRFLGIDTPETVHPTKGEEPGGREASSFVKKVLDGRTVWLEWDVQRKDHYDRQLCFIWLEDGSLLNLHLVMMGYARVLYIEPNRKYHKFFMYAEDAARESNYGIWKEIKEEEGVAWPG